MNNPNCKLSHDQRQSIITQIKKDQAYLDRFGLKHAILKAQKDLGITAPHAMTPIEASGCSKMPVPFAIEAKMAGLIDKDSKTKDDVVASRETFRAARSMKDTIKPLDALMEKKSRKKVGTMRGRMAALETQNEILLEQLGTALGDLAFLKKRLFGV